MNNLFHGKGVWHFGAGRFFAFAAVAALTLTGCRREATVQFYGQAQGTFYSVLYRDAQRRNLQPQVDSLLAAFDQSASLWVDSSLLRRLNAGLTDSLDDILFQLLTQSLKVEEYTGGAFNCRVGRLVQAWGFSFRERSEPDSTTLAALLRAAHGDIGLDGHRFRRQYDDTELDFNAIAQGYASDLVGQMLDSYGIHDYLVDIGGEVVARGDKGGGRPWRVGIEQPAKDSVSSPVVMTAIALRDASVVTSGSYRKYYERDGVRYSHTLDPVTGRPVQHTLLSVSVVEREGWLADAMATAYMVMGLDSARAFIDAHPDGPGTKAVLFIYDDHGELKTYETAEFKKLKI
ncbi:MAG: FAD:protein FMN transferase [Bacteroidales bacterium]|nr:FAD:protein FMN transferase [Bacteroidales bacterium]